MKNFIIFIGFLTILTSCGGGGSNGGGTPSPIVTSPYGTYIEVGDVNDHYLFFLTSTDSSIPTSRAFSYSGLFPIVADEQNSNYSTQQFNGWTTVTLGTPTYDAVHSRSWTWSLDTCRGIPCRKLVDVITPALSPADGVSTTNTWWLATSSGGDIIELHGTYTAKDGTHVDKDFSFGRVNIYHGSNPYIPGAIFFSNSVNSYYSSYYSNFWGYTLGSFSAVAGTTQVPQSTSISNWTGCLTMQGSPQAASDTTRQNFTYLPGVGFIRQEIFDTNPANAGIYLPQYGRTGPGNMVSN
jgi:hypothetical protein